MSYSSAIVKQGITTIYCEELMEKLSISEARRRLSELISRASAGEQFIIQRRGQPVAMLIPATVPERRQDKVGKAIQLARALGQSETLLRDIEEGKVHPIMAAFGLLR